MKLMMLNCHNKSIRNKSSTYEDEADDLEADEP